MASPHTWNSTEKRNSDEKGGFDAVGTISVVESTDGDEALHLVGKERTAQFSEECNKRLRRKLVRLVYRDNETFARVTTSLFSTGPDNSAIMRRGLFHAISVSLYHLCITPPPSLLE